MDPELRHEIEQIHALARDTHTLLRTVRRHQLLETFGKWIFYLILLLGGGLFFFQYFQPLTNKIFAPNSQFQKLLRQYETGQQAPAQ